MKVSIVGSGKVGTTSALYLAEERLAKNITVVDVIKGMPQGKMLDLLEASALRNYHLNLVGSNDYKEIAKSDIIVVTAGISRKPGMSRLDLLKVNQGIIKTVCKKIIRYAPKSLILMVTNPLDLMCHLALKVTHLKPERIFGMAGVLDTARFKYFISRELNASLDDIQTIVLGSHGEEMVPLISHTTVSGTPILRLLSSKQISKIVKKTRQAGAEIVAYLKDGSAYFAPAASIVEMIKAIKDSEGKRILPVSAYLEGEYGYRDVYCGVPVKLGKGGVEEKIELKLSKKEERDLKRSVEATKKAIGSLNNGFVKQ